METRNYQKASDTEYKVVITNVEEITATLDELVAQRDAAISALNDGKASNAAWETQMQANIDAQNAYIESIRALGIKTQDEVDAERAAERAAAEAAAEAAQQDAAPAETPTSEPETPTVEPETPTSAPETPTEAPAPDAPQN